MATKRIVHLRVYRGTEMNYSRDGKVKNVNQLVKLTYLSREWHNFLKHLLANGFCLVEVEKVFNEKGKEVKIPDNISAEVKEASHLEIKEQPLSESQKEVIELKKEIEGLKGNGADKIDHNTNIELSHYSLEGLEAKFPEIAKLKLTNVDDFVAKINELAEGSN